MEVPKLDDPVKVALIGTGNRASTIYQPLLPSLKDWVEVVACVDPVKAHCDRAAAALGARAYYDVRELVKDGIAEAALVVTPVPSHYAYSIYLSAPRHPQHVRDDLVQLGGAGAGDDPGGAGNRRWWCEWRRTFSALPATASRKP